MMRRPTQAMRVYDNTAAGGSATEARAWTWCCMYGCMLVRLLVLLLVEHWSRRSHLHWYSKEIRRIRIRREGTIGCPPDYQTIVDLLEEFEDLNVDLNHAFTING